LSGLHNNLLVKVDYSDTEHLFQSNWWRWETNIKAECSSILLQVVLIVKLLNTL